MVGLMIFAWSYFMSVYNEIKRGCLFKFEKELNKLTASVPILFYLCMNVLCMKVTCC